MYTSDDDDAGDDDDDDDDDAGDDDDDDDEEDEEELGTSARESRQNYSTRVLTSVTNVIFSSSRP